MTPSHPSSPQPLNGRKVLSSTFSTAYSLSVSALVAAAKLSRPLTVAVLKSAGVRIAASATADQLQAVQKALSETSGTVALEEVGGGSRFTCGRVYGQGMDRNKQCADTIQR